MGSLPVPPLLLNTICFAIGGVAGLTWALLTGQIRALFQVPVGVILFGALGLFGYHFLYFSALRLAPPAEAGLIAYLWPLLIVLFSGLLPGESLRPGHFVGAGLGFAGAALILLSGDSSGETGSFAGYGMALACAFTWAGYSVISRRLGDVPTVCVAGFCLVSAAFSLVAHLMLETTVWPADGVGWASVILLGLGPVGLAFFVWDIGVKNGDIQLLGAASYAAPLLSTLILIVAGIAQPGLAIAISAILITAGAVLASRASAAPG